MRTKRRAQGSSPEAWAYAALGVGVAGFVLSVVPHWIVPLGFLLGIFLDFLAIGLAMAPEAWPRGKLVAATLGQCLGALGIVGWVFNPALSLYLIGLPISG